MASRELFTEFQETYKRWELRSSYYTWFGITGGFTAGVLTNQNTTPYVTGFLMYMATIETRIWNINIKKFKKQLAEEYPESNFQHVDLGFWETYGEAGLTSLFATLDCIGQQENTPLDTQTLLTRYPEDIQPFALDTLVQLQRIELIEKVSDQQKPITLTDQGRKFHQQFMQQRTGSNQE